MAANKHKIIIKYYTGNTQNDAVFYGNCTTNIIGKELARTVKRIYNNELKHAIVIYPEQKFYFTISKQNKINFGDLTEEEYNTFVLDRYFNTVKGVNK